LPQPPLPDAMLNSQKMANRTGDLESQLCEKLFNPGKLRHHGPSFRNHLGMVVNRTEVKHFV
jgi:hypothetical protein